MFSSFFSRNFFPPPSATIFSIILLPLDFFYPSHLYAFHLLFPRPFIPAFACQNCVLSSFMREEVGRLGGFFLLWAHKNAPINTLQSCRGELAWLFQHFQNLQLQLMKVWLMLENHKLILKQCFKQQLPTNNIIRPSPTSFEFYIRDTAPCFETLVVL